MQEEPVDFCKMHMFPTKVRLFLVVVGQTKRRSSSYGDLIAAQDQIIKDFGLFTQLT